LQAFWAQKWFSFRLAPDAGKPFPAVTANTAIYAPPETFHSVASALNALEIESTLRSIWRNFNTGIPFSGSFALIQ
jgi:hypothetical protein